MLPRKSFQDAQQYCARTENDHGVKSYLAVTDTASKVQFLTEHSKWVDDDYWVAIMQSKFKDNCDSIFFSQVYFFQINTNNGPGQINLR